MKPAKYPIGIQTFEEIRSEGYLYADKTGYIYQLLEAGAKHVFLSRPRRFGKSLLLSTLEAYFEGRKELFEGLELGRLETNWQSYPVLRFSFASIETEEPSQVINSVNSILRNFEKKFDVEVNDEIESIGTRFGLLIQNVADKTGKKVVVLIDEYDKGIVDILKEEEKINGNTELFRAFYSQLKDQDHNLKFVFLTGVSRFRNLTLFSSPNQLDDISLDPKYAAICGLTESELYDVFGGGIEELASENEITVDEAKEQLRLKYDSYRFTRKEIYVYNPFSILKSLSKSHLGNYWISSGYSKVFIDYLKNSSYNLEEIESMWVSEDTLGGAYSLTDPVPLLFQTGYLTIKDYKRQMYMLGIPNGEVRSALIDQLAPQFLGIDSNCARIKSEELSTLANRGDAEGLMRAFQGILSQISHQHFRKNNLENIYSLSIWLICKMAGINARSEVSVAGGDIDMLIETPRFVYVIEFKKDKSAETAIQQIDSKAYSIPWNADGRTVIKIGIEFSSANRNISNWIIKK